MGCVGKHRTCHKGQGFLQPLQVAAIQYVFLQGDVAKKGIGSHMDVVVGLDLVANTCYDRNR